MIADPRSCNAAIVPFTAPQKEKPGKPGFQRVLLLYF
jgi:hypothetical protein